MNFVLKTDGAAYTIFENLNDRGLELFPLDLVKNYLFSQADRFPVGGLRDLEGRWTEIMTLLGSRADSFLRAFWASRHGSMEGTRLFTSFKKTYKTPEAAYQISVDMRAAAEHYAALFNSADPVWSRYSDNARQSVDALGVLGLTQSYPIILAALERKFSKAEMERLLHLLEVIAVRWQLVAGGRPGRVESLGGRAAREIFERSITKAAQVRSALKELYIPDAEFKTAFRTKSERSSKKARYLLEGIERQSLQRDGVAFPAELVPGDVKLEHILPKGAGDEWMAETDADPKLEEDMLYRLGNMCLLVKDRLGNKGFSEKRDVFAQSRLNTTKKVAERTAWGRKEIETRQGQMGELAAARWRFP